MRKGLLVFALSLFMASCTERKMEAPPQPAPYNAPGFTLKTPAGEDVTLESFKGKPLIINFWATWCAPCVEEMPMLDAFYRGKKNEGLVVLMINLKESAKIVTDFIAPNGYSFKVLMDESSKASEAFQVFGLPTTYFIDGRGMIVYSHMGKLTKEILYEGYRAITQKQT